MNPVENILTDKHTERSCPICGTVYVALKNAIARGKRTTCGLRCSYILRGNEKRGRTPGKTKTITSVSRPCSMCGKEHTRCASHVKGKHGASFCSRECHYRGRSAGLSKRVVVKPYTYTHDGLAKMRRTAARLYASGKALAYPKTEYAVLSELRARCPDVVHQHVFDTPDGAFVADFYIADRAIVVELDGRRAHRERTDADRERDAFLLSIGISTIRIPDDGVPENVVRAVLAALFDGAEAAA